MMSSTSIFRLYGWKEPLGLLYGRRRPRQDVRSSRRGTSRSRARGDVELEQVARASARASTCRRARRPALHGHPRSRSSRPSGRASPRGTASRRSSRRRRRTRPASRRTASESTTRSSTRGVTPSACSARHGTGVPDRGRRFWFYGRELETVTTGSTSRSRRRTPSRARADADAQGGEAGSFEFTATLFDLIVGRLHLDAGDDGARHVGRLRSENVSDLELSAGKADGSLSRGRARRPSSSRA